ncbi:transposase [Actibacterium sp. 188UL27-1]|uniref:transposase n=1 Tax=Actibacterium sp. 188UL27-1 TaxID=2786961 RepID=UPI00195789F2|nr:transposase [Actibacterium sp. 188UL27-1]
MGWIARSRYSHEDILRLLPEVELSLASGSDVATACRTAGVSDATYYAWGKRFGGMGRSEMANLKALQKENDRQDDC